MHDPATAACLARQEAEQQRRDAECKAEYERRQKEFAAEQKRGRS